MSSLRDGLGGEEVQVSGLQAGGVNIAPYWTNTVTTEASLVALGSVVSTGPVVAESRTLASMAVGSPSVWTALAQAGSTEASDEAVNINFGTAFGAVPSVSLTVGESGAAATQPGCIVDVNAGSFQFLGTSGLAYTWLAIGTKP